jgi:long-chain acyl-CoA synthetase
MSLGKLLESTCRSSGDRTAIIHNDIRLTYRDLDRAVNSLGNALRSRGIRKGDKIVIMLPNIPEFVIAYFAVQKLGGVAVTINTASTSHEMKYLLGNCDAAGLITSNQLAPRFEQIRKDLPLCRVLITADDPGRPSAFSEAIQAGPFALEAVDLSPEDPAAMIYTSGLTGRPLGAVLTQQNLLMQSDLMRIVIHGSENERVLCLIPLFHSFGAAVNMLNVVSLGGAIIMVNQFNLDSILKTVEREKITVIASVPRLFLGMLFHEGADKYDLSSIRLCVTGGAAIDPNLIPEFQKRFKVMIMEGYGLTEAAPVCAFGRLDMVQKPGSIGIHVPGVELKIFAQNDKELPPGEIGELVVKGINVMKGYYKDEAATAAVIKDGWLHTGDLALMDADGYVFLKGLKKRMVITSGFNVYPREVEMILEEHPAVEKARVAGKADLMRGEIVKAFVVQKTDALVDDKALMKHCRTYLSSYKVPREIEFVEKI